MCFPPVAVWSFLASSVYACHLTSNSFLTAWFQQSFCQLRAWIYEVGCYLNVVEERRRSAVCLKIDDRVFSRCRRQRTRSLGYLTVTQSLSVIAWRTNQPDELTHAAGCRSTVGGTFFAQWCLCLCQPVTGQFQSLSTWSERVTVVHVRVSCSLASSSRRRRGRDVPLSSVVMTTGHPQGPVVVDVVLTYYCRRRRTSR